MPDSHKYNKIQIQVETKTAALRLDPNVWSRERKCADTVGTWFPGLAVSNA